MSETIRVTLDSNHKKGPISFILDVSCAVPLLQGGGVKVEGNRLLFLEDEVKVKEMRVQHDSDKLPTVLRVGSSSRRYEGFTVLQKYMLRPGDHLRITPKDEIDRFVHTTPPTPDKPWPKRRVFPAMEIQVDA